ncbi:MAG: SMP-30/gluconolactonase/LRE family protein [Nitrospirae bacterium]|nr:SMP-30/gluconolactonase/LRE family protein [Nitrospirota bacterium]
MAAVRHIIFICLFSLLFAGQVSAFQPMEFVREIGEAGKQAKQSQFHAPRALAAHGDRLYVADTEAHRIVVLDQSGKTVLSWGLKGSKPGQFKYPAGIAIDEQGLVYVADTGNNRIQVFDDGGKWVRGFGARGDGLREFSGPTGITVSAGFVTIADTGNSRVQVLTTGGIAVRQITVRTKTDEMKAPVGVAVDAQHRIYVIDTGTDTARVFDPTGVQVRVFGSRGKGTAGLDRPQGIAVDSRGYIYIADTGNYKVKKFDPRGKLVGSIGSEGDGPGRFRELAGLIAGYENRIWVLDAARNTVQVISTEDGDAPLLTPLSPLPGVAFTQEMRGEVAAISINKNAWGMTGDSLTVLGNSGGGRIIGSRGSGPGSFKNARGLTVDGLGNFWVADTGNDRLKKFNSEGSLLHVFGKSGSGEGEFRSPSGVAVGPKGNIAVADTGNRRVQVFSSKGMFLGAFGKAGKLAGQFGEVVDIATDEFENLYVADRGNDRIAKYDSNGGLIWETGNTGSEEGEFREPENIVVSPDNEVYVLDAGNSRVQVFDRNGKFLRKFGSEGSDAGQFREPRGLALEEGLWLYVGDRGNKRAQVFILKHTPAMPKDVTAQAKINEVQVSWKANTETYLDQYKVYRADSPTDAFTLIGTSTTTSYLDKNLPSNRSFSYRVSSQAREGNESALSGVVSAVTPKLVPARPKRVRGEAWGNQITITWLPNLEPFVTHYQVYRSRKASTGYEFLAKTEKTIFDDGPLANDTLYYYQITAVGKEGDESAPGEVVVASTPRALLTAQPIEIIRMETGEVFASAYTYYESHPLGKVVIVNTADIPYQKVKVRFSTRDFMDNPIETEVPEIAAKQQVEVPLKPVFNKNILEVAENTPLPYEIAVTFSQAGEPRTVSRNFPLTLYERHAMQWDDKARLGAFVTLTDTMVADLSRQVVQQYADAYPHLPQTLVYARGIYEAFGVLGLKYIVDPLSPFQDFSTSPADVTYLQYPRETLMKKSGDCDDLSVLFAACLENIGIDTAFVDVPGHMFLLFNTGVAEADKITLGLPNELIVFYQGTVWIPVETTMVGTSFTRAWQKGAEEYRDWVVRNKANIINVQKTWDEFKPVTLPRSGGTVKVKRGEIEATFKGELEALASRRLAYLSAAYRNVLKKTPDDLATLGQLGILYGENGLFAEALEQFQKLLALDKTNALALNNIGNISYLQGRLDDARQAYEAALRSSPGEPGIMVNLARVSLQAGKKEYAKSLFLDAAVIDPRVVRQYADLAASLGVK